MVNQTLVADEQETLSDEIYNFTSNVEDELIYLHDELLEIEQAASDGKKPDAENIKQARDHIDTLRGRFQLFDEVLAKLDKPMLAIVGKED